MKAFFTYSLIKPISIEEKINAETSDLDPRVMCTSKSKIVNELAIN
jgi:hypothetical protein